MEENAVLQEEILGFKELTIIRSCLKKVLKDELAGTHYHKTIPSVLKKVENNLNLIK